VYQAKKPYSGAHFATFSEDLITPFVLAATSGGGACSQCGCPYRRACSGWQPGCGCGLPGGLPGDWELVGTPTGTRVAPDPTLYVGAHGKRRPRGLNEGRRYITRWEQRRYTEQLRASPYRDQMAQEAGTAFKHYLEQNQTGARPIPPDLLDCWIGRGWLDRVHLPAYEPPPTRPCIVLDPFCGTGTTPVVAVKHGRIGWAIDVKPEYLDLHARPRLANTDPLFQQDHLMIAEMPREVRQALLWEWEQDDAAARAAAPVGVGEG
jgi:hypothetical protein